MTGEQLLLTPCEECGLDNPHDGVYVACRRCTALLDTTPPDEGDRYAAYERISERVERFALLDGDRWP